MTEIYRVYRKIKRQKSNEIEEEYNFSEEGCFFHDLDEILNFTNIDDEIEELEWNFFEKNNLDDDKKLMFKKLEIYKIKK